MKIDELTMQFNAGLIDLPHPHQVINAYPLKIDSDRYVVEAIGLMNQQRAKSCPSANLSLRHWHLQNAGCVLVVDAGQLVGIFTKQDVVRLAASKINFSEVTMKQVMTQPVITMKLSQFHNLSTALSLLQQHQIDHLPIVDEQEELVGVVTTTSLLQGLNQLQMASIVEGTEKQQEERNQPMNKAVNCSLYNHFTLKEQRLELELSYQRLLQEIIERQIAEEALVESEEKFRHFAENHQAVIWIESSSSRKLLYVNPAYEKIWGRTAESLLSQADSWQESIHPEDRDRFQELIKPYLLGDSTDIEYRIMRPDGSVRWIWDRSFPLRSESGKIYCYSGIAEDITVRKQAEASLRESEERLSLALKAAKMGLFDWNLLTNAAIWSENMGLLYGLPAGTPCPSQEDFTNLLHPEDRQSFIQAVQQSIEQKQDFALEYRVVCPDGSIYWLSSKGVTYCDELGKPIRVIGTTRDITERKQAEQKIHEQAALLDITSDAIFVKDLDNQIIFWNQGAQRLYGWSLEEVIGKNPQDLLCQSVVSPSYEEAEKTVIASGVWSGELQKVTKSDKEMIVESRWTLMRDGTGKPKSILIVDTDITEKKQLEEQFFRAQRLECLGTLAGGIAHDLNNILTPIVVSTQLLKTKIQQHPERSQQLISMIENNAKRGAALVKQVLSFGRGFKGERSIVQLKHLITDIILIGKQTFPKSIEFGTYLSSDLLAVSGDITQLHQVLMNLVVNARDAMPEGGKITITAENIYIDEAYARMTLNAKVGHYILVKVRDTGIGIAPEILDKIFEPFFTTKAVGTGTGLGLATVMGITNSHGGFINVQSKVGEGSEFQLFLPAVPGKLDLTPEERDIPQGNGELILVVDDEPQICEIVQMILENHNYKVITACNGIEAIVLYAQHKHQISIVLMDMMMPEMDGATAIRTMQRMNPNVQIIAASGLSSKEGLTKLSEIGIEQVLPKPFTAKELLYSLYQFNMKLHRKELLK